MNCAAVQKKLRDYFDDILPERTRRELRAHLSECTTCRDHAFRLGSLAGDLKQLLQTTIPFDLTQAILTGLANPIPEEGLFSLSSRKIGVSLILGVLCLAGFFTAYYLKSHPVVLPPKASENKLAPQQAAMILENLKLMDEKLSRTAAATSSNRPTVTSLDPFHWHLEFLSVAERQGFLERMRKLRRRMEFEADYLQAFSMEQNLFGELLSLIKNSSGTSIQGPHVDLDRLPQSQTPLHVSLLMDAKGSASIPQWRLHFLRQNSYRFTEGLREAGFQFLHESKELAVVQVSASQYQVLQDEIRQMPGLQAVHEGGSDSPAESSQGAFPVILFLEEE